MRSSICGVGALVGVLALMGCASAEEKDYLREMNAICAAAEKRLDELPRPSSLAEIAKVTKEEVAIRKEAIAELGEAAPPINIAGGAHNVYSDLEAREERAHALEKAAEEKDRREVRKIREEGRTEFPVEAQRAMAMGLPACAEL